MRFSIWDEPIANLLSEGVSAKVRFFEKPSPDGKYKNKTISGVAVLGQDGTFGAWVEGKPAGVANGTGFKKGGYSKSPQETDSINTSVCLKAAIDIVCAKIAKEKVDDSLKVYGASAVELTLQLKAALFAAKAEEPKAPAPVKAKAPPKPAPVEDDEQVVEIAEEVPF